MIPRYVLEFRDTTGTDEEVWVTFRLRGTWARRLKKGMSVYLLDTKARQIYGQAKVLSVTKGRIWDMLRDHAAWCHLEVHRLLSPDSRAPERLFDLFKATYGPNRVGDDSIVSVIELKRTK